MLCINARASVARNFVAISTNCIVCVSVCALLGLREFNTPSHNSETIGLM
jgi:hypothetical protein